MLSGNGMSVLEKILMNFKYPASKCNLGEIMSIDICSRFICNAKLQTSYRHDDTTRPCECRNINILRDNGKSRLASHLRINTA